MIWRAIVRVAGCDGLLTVRLAGCRATRTMSSEQVGPLVSTSWLNDALKSTDPRELRVLDVSFIPDKSVNGHSEFFLKGHIPGARYFDLHKSVASTALIPRNLPEEADWASHMVELGVCSNTHVVTYASGNNMAAVRLWWMMRLYGHENTSVLDGGMVKWVEDGYGLTTDDPQHPPVESDFKVNFNSSLLRDYNSILKNVESGDEQLVDARSTANYTGVTENSGHIPRSKSIPFASYYNKDGTFKSKEDLKQLFDTAGVDLSRPIVGTCGTGMTACTAALAATLLGCHPVPVYYGSWTEWKGRAPDNLKLTGNDVDNGL